MRPSAQGNSSHGQISFSSFCLYRVSGERSRQPISETIRKYTRGCRKAFPAFPNLVYEVGREDEVDASGLNGGNAFGESSDGGRVRVADGDG